jgi:3'-5' exonuclease
MADNAIIKAGCSIDQDMMELYLYTHHNQEVARTTTFSSQGFIHEARSRLDLGGIRLINSDDDTTDNIQNNNNNGNTVGLKTLAAEILGVRLVKSTRLAASDWSRLPLTPAQIAYSARDAWTSAAIVAELANRRSASSSSLLDLCSTMSNCDGGFGGGIAKHERPIQELVQRQSKRKRAQRLLKHLVFLQTRRQRIKQQQAMLMNDIDRDESVHTPPPSLFQTGSWRRRVLQNLKTIVQENKWDAPEILNVPTTTTTISSTA